MIGGNPGQDFVDAVNEMFEYGRGGSSEIREFIAHMFEETTSSPVYPVPRARMRILYDRSAALTAPEGSAMLLVKQLERTVHAIILKLAFCSGCLA
jgi:hypothetical protein